MKRFTKKIAKEIANTSFGYVLDCLMGYSDSYYDLNTETEVFEQNFEEDIKEKGFVVTDRKIEMCIEEYEKLKKSFEVFIRKKYYN